MRRLTCATRAAPSISGASIEVGGTVAVPPNRRDRFGPTLLQIREHFGGLLETSFGRFRDAEVQDPAHAAGDILARELQALHRLAERFLHDRTASRPAAAQGAVQKSQDLVAPAEPPLHFPGIFLVGLAHFEGGPAPSFASFKAWALRFSSWIRS